MAKDLTLPTLKEELTTASLPEIAALITHDWSPPTQGNMNQKAAPYVDAMFCINSVQDHYGAKHDGYRIVLYFLSNASTWRGPVARLVKAELKSRVQ